VKRCRARCSGSALSRSSLVLGTGMLPSRAVFTDGLAAFSFVIRNVVTLLDKHSIVLPPLLRFVVMKEVINLDSMFELPRLPLLSTALH
jgi:hypothetical protein